MKTKYNNLGTHYIVDHLDKQETDTIVESKIIKGFYYKLYVEKCYQEGVKPVSYPCYKVNFIDVMKKTYSEEFNLLDKMQMKITNTN